MVLALLIFETVTATALEIVQLSAASRAVCDPEVVPIASWGHDVDRYARPTHRSRIRLALDPIGVPNGRQILVNHDLIGTQSTRSGVVPIVAHAKDPRVVAGGH